MCSVKFILMVERINCLSTVFIPGEKTHLYSSFVDKIRGKTTCPRLVLGLLLMPFMYVDVVKKIENSISQKVIMNNTKCGESGGLCGENELGKRTRFRV